MSYKPYPEDSYLNERFYSYLSAYGGYVFTFGTFIAFFAIGNLVPPPDPSWSAQELGQFYSDNRVRLLFAGIVGLAFSPLYMSLYSLVSQIMEEHYNSPLLAKIQLISALMGEVFIYLLFIFIALGAYRPERSPEITQMLNDAVWFFSWWTVSTVQIQSIVIAVVILRSKKAEIFPRWFGWFVVYADCGAFLGAFIPLFKIGPFAYDGELTFWFMVPLYGVYCLLTCYACVKALRKIDVQLGVDTKWYEFGRGAH